MIPIRLKGMFSRFMHKMRSPMLELLSLLALSQAQSLEVVNRVIDRMNFTQYPLVQGRKLLQVRISDDK